MPSGDEAKYFRGTNGENSLRRQTVAHLARNVRVWHTFLCYTVGKKGVVPQLAKQSKQSKASIEERSKAKRSKEERAGACEAEQMENAPLSPRLRT